MGRVRFEEISPQNDSEDEEPEDGFYGNSKFWKEILEIVTENPGDRDGNDLKKLMQATKTVDAFAEQHERVHHDCCRWMFLEERKEGFKVYFQGEVASKMYIVLRGEVTLSSAGESPIKVRPGGSFGGSDIQARDKRQRAHTANVTSRVPAAIAVVTKVDYQNSIQEQLQRTFKPIVQYLNSVPALKASQASHDEIFKLAQKLKQFEYPAHKTLIAQGGFSTGLWFVESGTCVLRRIEKGKKRHTLDLAIFGNSTMFGDECFGCALVREKKKGSTKEVLAQDPKLGPEGAPFAEAVVTTGPVTGFWISKHDFGQLRCRDKLLTAMAKMKQLKVGWRQQHVARAKGVPDAHEPFRETFGMSEDEDESEDEDAESVAESVDLDDPNYRAPWDLRPIAPPPRAGSISRLGHSYEESLVPMDIHEALGETPKPPSILDPAGVIFLPKTWKVRKFRGSSSMPRAASAPPGDMFSSLTTSDDPVLGGKARRTKVAVPNYESRLAPKISAIPKRDKEAVKRAATPISSWSKMGLPVPSRLKAREATMIREKEAQQNLRQSSLSSDRMMMFKSRGLAAPIKEWETHWSRRGWKDPHAVQEEDIPLIAEMPVPVRIQYDKVRQKIHAPGKMSRTASSIFNLINK